jgi:glycosyltransferase involved in cell wall biosynthesis
MRIALVTDAWQPQVNGVVTTLVELVRELMSAGHTVQVIHPGQFKTRPCPGYAGIDLAVRPAKGIQEQLESFMPDAIHLATEGPLGWAARAYCIKHRLRFTTAYHTRFPEILKAAIKIPLIFGYALFKHFHRPSAGVMVPTQGVLALLEQRGFQNLRLWTHGVDTRLFTYSEKPQTHPLLAGLPRPISLFVGRVSYEKNIESFLKLDVDGSKVVCGVGPLEANLKERFPNVLWLGVLPRTELALIYAASDIFVMPSLSETFGLVMLEAMATGTPVAAYPVDGPLEVLGWKHRQSEGGVMHEDLKTAWAEALLVPRIQAYKRASEFSWSHAQHLFLSYLIPSRNPSTAHGLPDKLTADPTGAK